MRPPHNIGESGKSRPEINDSVGVDALPQPRRIISSEAPGLSAHMNLSIQLIGRITIYAQYAQ